MILILVSIAGMGLLATSLAHASEFETVLYQFSGGNDGGLPVGNIMRDANGNLYGVTLGGGNTNGGTVFELSQQPGGGWVQNTLHSFGNNPDGLMPSGGVVMDASGNLFGVTQRGGIGYWGTVYELSPDGKGNYTESVLWSFFEADRNGDSPFGSLTLDAAGNLYGTATQGGRFPGGCSVGCGLVFELVRPKKKGGNWKYKALYRFLGPRHGDGQYPNGGLLFDAAGNLYGTTLEGGNSFWGTVFELSPSSHAWTESVLYSFLGSPNDGGQPETGVIEDEAGNLYGLTSTGGVLNSTCSYGCGTVFELSSRSGVWTEQVLYAFTGGADGGYPSVAYSGSGEAYGAGLALNLGSLYGTTAYGGSQPGFSGYGLVFELSPSGGAWTEQVLHTFTSSPDGNNPLSGVVLDPSGNIYGATSDRGAVKNHGSIYEISTTPK